MITPDIRRGSVLCAFFAAALFLMFQSWDRLHGHLNYRQLQDMKEQWRATERTPHDRELNRGFKLGYRAVESEKSNSDYRYMLASLHSWRQGALRLWPDQANAESGKVIENLKAALVRRPSWFEAWISLALVKLQAGEIDHELRVALEKAIESGKYETNVHHGVAFVGFRIWNTLGIEMRNKITETLNIALENRRVNRFVVEQIVMSGQLDMFKNELEGDPVLAGYAKEFLEKRKEAL